MHNVNAFEIEIIIALWYDRKRPKIYYFDTRLIVIARGFDLA